MLLFHSLTYPLPGHTLLSDELFLPSPEVSALPRAQYIPHVLNDQEAPFPFIFYFHVFVFVLNIVPPAGLFHTEPPQCETSKSILRGDNRVILPGLAVGDRFP